MSQLPDDVLTDIVRRSRCVICDGTGVRRARAQDSGGTPVAGIGGYVDCRECDGQGIHLGICRRLAREHAEKP